jgi:hypothetical protein
MPNHHCARVVNDNNCLAARLCLFKRGGKQHASVGWLHVIDLGRCSGDTLASEWNRRVFAMPLSDISLSYLPPLFSSLTPFTALLTPFTALLNTSSYM